jgi:hypothetical protein
LEEVEHHMKLTTLIGTILIAILVTGCGGNGTSQLIATHKATIQDLDGSNSSHTLVLEFSLYSNGSGDGTFVDSSPYSEPVRGTARVWRDHRTGDFRFLARYKGQVARGEVEYLPPNQWKEITVNYHEVDDGVEAKEPHKSIPYDILLENR